MYICPSTKLILSAFFTGFIGDALLQIIVKNNLYKNSDWGLRDYFTQHGIFESMTIAGGMMVFFYILAIFSQKFKLPINYISVAIYGILIDLFFRKTMIFSSLQGYYNSLNYGYSAVWGAIPMMIVLFIYSHI